MTSNELTLLRTLEKRIRKLIVVDDSGYPLLDRAAKQNRNVLTTATMRAGDLADLGKTLRRLDRDPRGG